MMQTLGFYGIVSLILSSSMLLACDAAEIWSGFGTDGVFWCQSSDGRFRDNFCGKKKGDCPDGWTFFNINTAGVSDFPDPEICCEANDNQFFFAGEQCPPSSISVDVSEGSCALEERCLCVPPQGFSSAVCVSDD